MKALNCRYFGKPCEVIRTRNDSPGSGLFLADVKIDHPLYEKGKVYTVGAGDVIINTGKTLHDILMGQKR